MSLWEIYHDLQPFRLRNKFNKRTFGARKKMRNDRDS